jgi:hypothetical protein
MNATAFLENLIPSVLSGSALLPLQSGDRSRHARISDGECRLILAVLEDAIQCYLNYWNEPFDIKKRRCAWEANRWIDSPSKTGLFAYENVCLLLEIEPDRLRQELRRLASRKRRRDQTSQFNRRVLGAPGAATAKNGHPLKSA